MPWIISFLVSWILFFLLIDRPNLKTNVYGGLYSLVLASIVDWGGQQLDLYKFHDIIIPWFGCSAFYKFGPVFVMGILFCQSIPQKKWLQVLNIFVFATLFISLEYLVLQTRVAQYIHWHILASFLLDLLAFSSLTWFTKTFLKNS